MKKKIGSKVQYPQFKGLTLTVKQQAFVVAYCRPEINWNATQAYVQAFGTEIRTNATRAASAILKKPDVVKAVNVEIARRVKS